MRKDSPNPNIMKKRLTLWDNFFERTREKFLDNSETDASADNSEKFTEDDPLFNAAEEEYWRVRESLLSELGSSEGSMDIECGSKPPHSKYSKTDFKRPLFLKKQRKCVKRHLKKYDTGQTAHSNSDSCAEDSCVKSCGKLDYSTQHVYSRDEYQEYYKHYELWKKYKRIKASRRTSSMYIVSCLNEEPSEANRYVPDLPPKVVRPELVPPRFSLK